MNDARIYVIIVTYNGSRWVESCFGSLRQSSVPLMCVVVDNASTDGTPDLIAARFPEVHLIRSSENLGFGRGNNQAIRYALSEGADYVFLLNQDAWIFPDTIAQLLTAEDATCGILSPVHLDGKAFGMDRMFKDYLFEGRHLEDDRALLRELTTQRDVPFVNAAAWLLPRHTLESVGGFDPLFSHYGEDNNYCQRVLHHDLRIRVVPGARICHDRQGGRSPLQTAWVSRYLTIIYADPQHTALSTTLRTCGLQLKLLASIPVLWLRGRKAEAAAIVEAYRNFWTHRRQIAQSRKINTQRGAHWL
ncbi:MAG: glycosyltransferase family 2 protein [Alistipes sp.]